MKHDYDDTDHGIVLEGQSLPRSWGQQSRTFVPQRSR